MRSAGIDPASGQEVYIKKNGNYTFTYDKNERVEVGNTNPMLEGSLFTSLSYRGFTLNVTAAYKFGGDIYNTTLANKVEYIDVKIRIVGINVMFLLLRTVEETGRLGAFLGDSGERER